MGFMQRMRDEDLRRQDENKLWLEKQAERDKIWRVEDIKNSPESFVRSLKKDFLIVVVSSVFAIASTLIVQWVTAAMR